MVADKNVITVMTTASENSLLPTWSLEEIRNLQNADPDVKQVVQWIESNSIPSQCPEMASPAVRTLWNQRKQLVLENGVLYRKWKDIPSGGLHPRLQLVVPVTLAPDILSGLHDSPIGGHLGAKKTLEKVRSRFYWPGQRQYVHNWCSRCYLCATRKSPAKARAPLQVTSGVSRPFQRLAMDILGPLPETRSGNRYILVIGDYFTKWKEAFAMKDMEATTIARLLVNEVICRFGVPDSIHTDQGRNFESTLIQEICKLLEIKKTRTTPYHPQSDGLIERFNRTLLNMLSMAVVDDEHSWDLKLPTLLLAYRTSIQDTTGATPFELMFGRKPQLPEDVMYSIPSSTDTTSENYADLLKDRLSDAYQRVNRYMEGQQRNQKKYYDRGQRGKPYAVGDIVLLHEPAVQRGNSRKFHRPWKGPFKIVKVISSCVYRIQHCKHSRRRKVVHFNRLKPDRKSVV